MSTLDTISQIAEMYEKGASVQEIAVEFDRARSTIYAMLQDAGVTLRENSTNIASFIDASLVNQVVQDYARGVTLAKIKRTSGLSQHTIYRILEQASVPLRGSASEKESDDRRVEQAIQMYKDGFKLVKIEVDTGVSSTMLYKALYREGVPLRSELP